MADAVPVQRPAPPVGVAATFSAAAAAFREGYFGLYWVDNVAFVVGQGLVLLGAQWLMLDLTDSRTLLGWIGAIQAIVVITLSPAAGVLADRLARRDLLIVARLALAVVITVMGVVTLAGAASVPLLLVVVGLSAAFLAITQPASQTYVYDLVGPDRLMNAIALNALGTGVFQIVGPSVGGSLVGSVGSGATYVVGGVGYVIGAVALMAIPIRETARRKAGTSMTADLAEGAAHLKRDPLLRWVFLPVILVTVFAGAILVMRPVFAREVLDVGAGGLGLLGAAFGLGSLAGSLFVIGIAPRLNRKGVILLLSPLTWTLCMVFYALSSSLLIDLGLEFVMGISAAFYSTSVLPILQVRVPDHLRSRVLAVYFMIMQCLQLNWLLTGFTADRIGDRPALFLMGIIPAALMVVMLLVLRPMMTLGTPANPLVPWRDPRDLEPSAAAP